MFKPSSNFNQRNFLGNQVIKFFTYPNFPYSVLYREELKVSIPTIDRQTKIEMPHIKIGKAVRFELDEVVKWLKEQ